MPGVWITGAGGGGLSAVATNSSLTGNGTSGSKLSVADWPLSWWSGPELDTAFHLGGANAVAVLGFGLSAAVTFSKIAVYVGAADAVNNYDFGIYSKAGALLANIGAQPLPSTGVQSFNTVQASQTILPGLYLFAYTGAAVTAFTEYAFYYPTWFANANLAASTGGALPVSVGAQVITPNTGQFWFQIY